MATGVLERIRTDERTDSSLKAYGKLSGGAEPAEMTEEQKALNFNSRISDNYKKLINPDLKKAEEIMGEAPVQENYAEPVYDSPESYARAMLYPEREQEQQQVPQFAHQRVTEDIFRADSPINNRAAVAEPVAPAYEQPVYEQPVYEQPTAAYAEEVSEDLTPTMTTIQYRSDLYRDEQRVVKEEKKGYSMTAKGKLLMCVYAIVVAVVLALIIINTSVLNNLDSSIAAREAELNSVMTQSQALKDEIAELTSDSSIISRAEEELGMVRN